MRTDVALWRCEHCDRLWKTEAQPVVIVVEEYDDANAVDAWHLNDVRGVRSRIRFAREMTICSQCSRELGLAE